MKGSFAALETRVIVYLHMEAMMNKKSKVKYVKRQRQNRDHTCHWPGCKKQVTPAMWGCKPHWFKLPKKLREKIWQAYVPGQEQRMDPSDTYMEVAQEVQEWIEGHIKREKGS